jgi:hypothetical protein
MQPVILLYGTYVFPCALFSGNYVSRDMRGCVDLVNWWWIVYDTFNDAYD